MNTKGAFRFLKAYTTDPLLINRLFVSAFIATNNITQPQSLFLNKYFIGTDQEEFESLLSFIQLTGTIDLENLIQLFEFVVSPEDKVINGAVYTPRHIREFIIKNSFQKKNITTDSRIGDIACGCGSFLLTSAQLLRKEFNRSFADIFQNNLFGLDIQEYSIERTKILLTLLAAIEGEEVPEFTFNLFCANALDFDWHHAERLNGGFDFIFGNPPYVCSRNMDMVTKELALSFEVARSGHPDLYIPFFQVGIENLKDGGLLGYITVNSFFKSVNGRNLRAYFQMHSYNIDIIDFGGEQIFNDRSTYTCLCFVVKEPRTFINYIDLPSTALNRQNAITYNAVEWSVLNAGNGWILKDVEFINAIEQTGTPLSHKYKTKSGIATLKNDLYIFTPARQDELYYYIGENSEQAIEKDICVDIINSNKLVENPEGAAPRQKIIFPYEFQNENSKPALIDEEKFKQNFPCAYQYLSAKREVLARRDGGKGKYERWYAYGRNQSLEKTKFKLFFPHLSSGSPCTQINSEDGLLFYNGMAAVATNFDDLKILQVIMQSAIFWRYITSSSKPYSSGYYSLSRNYIKDFGIPEFSDSEKAFLLNANDKESIEQMLQQKYAQKLQPSML